MSQPEATPRPIPRRLRLTGVVFLVVVVLVVGYGLVSRAAQDSHLRKVTETV